MVTTPHLAHQLVAILRDMLIELSRAQLSEKGKEEKTAEIYRYLRSEEFKNSLHAINSRTKDLRDSLEREKSSHEGWWTRREQDYSAIARQTALLTTRSTRFSPPRQNVILPRCIESAPDQQLALVTARIRSVHGADRDWLSSGQGRMSLSWASRPWPRGTIRFTPATRRKSAIGISPVRMETIFSGAMRTRSIL